MNKFKPGQLLFYRHHTTAFRLYLAHSSNDKQSTYNLISLGDYPLSINPDKDLRSLISQKERLISLLKTDITPLRKSETIRSSRYQYADTSKNYLSLEEYLHQIDNSKYPLSSDLKDKLRKLNYQLIHNIYNNTNPIPHIGL